MVSGRRIQGIDDHLLLHVIWILAWSIQIMITNNSISNKSTSLKNRFMPGQLYELINGFGRVDGICMFIEIVEPGTLTLEEAVRPNHWHMKILRNGKIEYRDTSISNLIELPYELVNHDDNP